MTKKRRPRYMSRDNCPKCGGIKLIKESEHDFYTRTCIGCGFMYTIRPCSSDHSSQALEDLTLDSLLPDTNTSSSASQTPTVERSSEPDSQTPQSLATYALSENQRGELLLTRQAHQLTSGGGKPGQGYSAVAFLAKTSQSQEREQDLMVIDRDCSSSSQESLPFSNRDISFSKMYQVSSLATAVGTSDSSLKRWPTSGMAWHGGFLTADSSECRSAEGVCSSSEPSLVEILSPPQDVQPKYWLSAKAAAGILRRAKKRGRTIPAPLLAALEAVAQTTTTPKPTE